MKATGNLKRAISVLLIAVLALGALALSGCNTKSEASKKIVIWAYDYYIDAAKEAVKQYEGIDPGVEFEIVELGQDDLVEKFRIALASGNKDILPDIVCEEDYNLKGYLEFYEDNFVDLTSYVDPALYVDFKVKNVTYNDKIWGVPYDTAVGAWFYRSDIFEDAGFSEEDLQNITWDRFVEIGQAIKEKTGKYIIPLVPEGNIEGRVMLQSAGSWYYDDDGALDITNNKAIVDMTETIKTLMASGVIYEVTSWDDIIAAFYNGTTAGVIGGSWWAPIISENDSQFGLWRVAPIPRMTGDSKYTNFSNTGGCSWLVLNKSNKQTAIDFLMDTLAVSDSIANVLVKEKMVVPALISARSVENAQIGDPYFGNQNLCELMAEWSAHVPYVNYSSHSYEIAYYHGSLFPDYLRGKTAVEDVIKALQQQAEIIEAQ